jgi:hypothetical protein
MRIMPFGKRAEGMAVYVILEEQLRVVVQQRARTLPAGH